MGKEILNILKALADESRLRILCLLRQRDLCVCELEEVMKTSQSNISRHLTKLKDRGLITSEKQAQFVIHKIDKEMTGKYPFVLEILDSLLKEDKYRADAGSLKKLDESGGAVCRITKA